MPEQCTQPTKYDPVNVKLGKVQSDVPIRSGCHVSEDGDNSPTRSQVGCHARYDYLMKKWELGPQLTEWDLVPEDGEDSPDLLRRRGMVTGKRDCTHQDKEDVKINNMSKDQRWVQPKEEARPTHQQKITKARHENDHQRSHTIFE